MDDKGFIKLLRSGETVELMKHGNEYLLLSLIAYRARRTNSFDDLEPSDALLGDYEACGLTRQKYRTALKNLKTWGFITIKSTNKGTIAKLINTEVFDINADEANHHNDHRSTIKQPSTNHQATTNKNVKKERMEEVKKNGAPSGSSHFSNKVGHYYEEIKSLSQSLSKNPEIIKQKFNPFQFVQMAVNEKAHPAGIIDALTAIDQKLSKKESVKSIMAYGRAVLKTKSQSYREKEHIKEAEKIKKALNIPGHLAKLVNNTFKEMS
ncbi:hypothetical protein ACFL7M_05960 [Thermodesulfobacteriota bacterium]